MTKGRGSNERRRSARQKRANWINRFGTKELVDRFTEARAGRMWGGRNPKNFIVGRHPLERKR